jgi:hypothetical protein
MLSMLSKLDKDQLNPETSKLLKELQSKSEMNKKVL